MKIEYRLSTAHHNETVDSIERSHRTLNEYIMAYVSNETTDWEIYIKYFTFSYNITGSGAFSQQYSPCELVYGKTANIFGILAEILTIRLLFCVDLTHTRIYAQACTDMKTKKADFCIKEFIVPQTISEETTLLDSDEDDNITESSAKTNNNRVIVSQQ